MKLYCYSRKDFVNTMKENGWTNGHIPDNVAIISICCTKAVRENYHSAHYQGKHDENYFYDANNVLNLDFDDIDEEVRNCGDYTAYNINKRQVIRACEFIDKHIDCDFYIHCNAGMSRSQAFVKYIQDCYPDREWETRKENPCRFPNMYTCNMLKRWMWCTSNNGIKINEAFDAISSGQPPFCAKLDDVTEKGGLGYSITAL